MYNYWRSVVTMESKILPDFGDHRPEGIQQMEKVEDQGVFMGPLASFALAFTWIEEKDYRKATSACARNRARYPNNVVNNLTCGTIFIYDRHFPEALAVFDRVLAVDATNIRVHYLRGWALMRSGQLDDAKNELTKYLGSEYLEPYQRSYGLLRLGQVYARQQNDAKALESYQAAIKIDGNKEAKAAIERLEEKKKTGKVSQSPSD
jgi:predicted Zn-dependent protease